VDVQQPGSIEEEQRAFDRQLPSLLEKHEGKFVLFKNGQVVEVFDDEGAAYEAGLDRFGIDTIFLIAKIEESDPQPVSISWELGLMFKS
jgi:hypothetical protein